MLQLYKREDWQTEGLLYKGELIELLLYFNRVLACFEIYKDNDFNQEAKVRLSFDMITNTKKKYDIIFKNEFMNHLFKEVIGIKGKEEQVKKTEPQYDFIHDADYIYSSFMMDYKMDLHDQIDKLSWFKFLALFDGLSEATKQSRVQNIRTMEIPKPTKHNADRIRKIREAKEYYSLSKYMTEEEKQEIKQEKLNSFAQKMLRWAESTNKNKRDG